MKIVWRWQVLGWLFAVVLAQVSCGSEADKLNSSFSYDYEKKPERFALVADSIATGLFADSKFAQAPDSRPSEYAKLKSVLGVLAGLKHVLRDKEEIFRIWQIIGDMNQTFAPFTNPFKSLYHRAAYNRGSGSHIVKESAIIASKVVPESYQRHISNYTNWNPRDFTSIIFALGSNDICNSWQTGDQFEHNYREALRHLTSTFPDRRLYIVSPPHIPNLAQDQIANAPIFGMPELQCRDYFEIVTCPSYRDADRFYDFIARIRKVASEFSQAVFVDLSEEPFNLEDVSGDCFHPSFKGHEHFTYKLESYL